MKLFAPVLDGTADGPAVYVFPYAGATVPSFFTFARDRLEGYSVYCADLPGRTPCSACARGPTWRWRRRGCCARPWCRGRR